MGPLSTFPNTFLLSEMDRFEMLGLLFSNWGLMQAPPLEHVVLEVVATMVWAKKNKPFSAAVFSFRSCAVGLGLLFSKGNGIHHSGTAFSFSSLWPWGQGGRSEAPKKAQ